MRTNISTFGACIFLVIQEGLLTIQHRILHMRYQLELIVIIIMGHYLDVVLPPSDSAYSCSLHLQKKSKIWADHIFDFFYKFWSIGNFGNFWLYLWLKSGSNISNVSFREIFWTAFYLLIERNVSNNRMCKQYIKVLTTEVDYLS